MDSSLSNMIAEWHMLKAKEQQYHDARLKIEEAIQELLQIENLWKPFGTMTFDGLKIRNNYRRLWDQKLLAKIKAANQFDAARFPFVVEYKELKTQSDYLEKREPQIWHKLSQALTIYATKPYFFIPEKRG